MDQGRQNSAADHSSHDVIRIGGPVALPEILEDASGNAPPLGCKGEQSGAAGRPLPETEARVCCVCPKRDTAEINRMNANL